MKRYDVRLEDGLESIEASRYVVGGIGDEDWTIFYGEDGQEVARFKSERVNGIVVQSGPSMG